MKEVKKKGIQAEQKIYAVLLAAGIIALASLTLLYGRKTKNMDDVVEQNIELDDDSPVTGQVSTEEKEEETTEGQALEKATEEEAGAGTEPRTTAKVQRETYNGKDKLAWPVSGNVLIPYSMDTTVYFETLDQYQCNPALYIQAEKGTKVKAIFGGQVKSVDEDARLGNVVAIDMGNGYEATYGQLADISCQEGDYVETGSVIGKVAEPTNFYLLEGSHLYIQMTKDKKPVNPTDYFQS